jgi:hypothetical protein
MQLNILPNFLQIIEDDIITEVPYPVSIATTFIEMDEELFCALVNLEGETVLMLLERDFYYKVYVMGLIALAQLTGRLPRID